MVDSSGQALTDKTDLTIKPDVAGGWSFRDPSTLVFTPQVGFRPQTEYTVTLRSVQTTGKQDRIEGKRVYQRVFTTPALRLQKLEVTRWDAEKGRVDVLVKFSGGVDIRQASALRWRIDGIARRYDVSKGSRPDTWIAKIKDRALKPGASIEVTAVARRIRSVVDANIRVSGSASVTLPRAKAMFIQTAGVVEGSDGFFIKVICQDEASVGDGIEFWDRQLQRYFEVSPRCVLDADSAKAKLRFEPKVDFDISPTRGGFRVHGPFKRGPVTMTIDVGTKTVDGAATVSRFRRTLTIPARRPKLDFVVQGRYLPSAAWGSLALRHQNVSKAIVTIRHVRAENVVRWLADSGQQTDYKNSDLVFKREITLEAGDDVLETTALPLKTYLADPPPGVVEIQVRDKARGSVRATVRFGVTDLNMLAKRHRDGTLNVWVLGVHDHRPVPNVEVASVVYSGREIDACRTDANGACSLTGLPKETVDKTKPFALVARAEGDFTFIRFDQVNLDTSGNDVQGARPSRKNPYRASIYSDRGVYRPGDVAHVVAIVRAKDNRAPPVGMPVQVELLDPKRKVSRRLNLKTNEAGIVATDFQFADFADTGRYQAVFKAAKRTLGRYAFNVEEFVPERMEVAAKPAQTAFGSDDDALIDVSARYLFGGSAQGSRFDLRCELTPIRFKPKQHTAYTFDIWREKPAGALALGQVSGTLGEEGASKLACPSLTGRGRLRSAGRLRAMVSVFESGSGRATRGETTAVVHPAPVYIGLKSSVDRVEQDKAFKVEGVVVDWNGEVDGRFDTVELEILKVEREYGWVYDEIEGRWIDRRHAHLVRTDKRKVPVKKGRFAVELSVAESASAYVVRATAGGIQGDLSLSGSWNDWWYWDDYGRSSNDATPRPQKPGTLTISAPKETSVGEKVEVSVKAPYAGRLLWTVESNGVKTYDWQNVKPGKVDWSFEVEEFEPNLYVSALLLKDPHEESAKSFLPSRAYGVRSVRVRPDRYLQDIEVRAPDEVRSNASFEVEIDLPEADRPMFVTVAAVDEGILSLTKFATPDPAKTLFERLALGVSTYETIGWNVSLPAGDLGRSTGGGGPDAPGRVQMVKPVALWSGVKEVPAKGPLKVRFDVPAYRGKLRIMVVGAGPERLVSASKSILVRDPIVLQTTLPRFLVQGDSVQVPVFLTNLSGAPQKVSVRFNSETLALSSAEEAMTAEEAVEVKGPPVRQVDLPKDGQATLIYRLEAKAAVGAARMTVEVKAPKLTVRESLEVPFVANAPVTKEVQRLELAPGTLDLKPKLEGWLPTTESSSFWITANPYGDVFDHLTYLIRYPYGCVEQTTSATRPMLFLGNLVRNVDPKYFSQSKLENAVNAGIERVLSMQTASGGFGYWPGASRPVYWGTAYATHMLIDAKKQGFSVPQDRIDEALAWMKRALTTSSDPSITTYQGPYMHYVLALGGQGAKAQMLEALGRLDETKSSNRFSQRYLDELKFLLQAGLHVAGDRQFEAQLRNPDVRPILVDRRNGWAFYSDQRRRGMMLSVLVDLFGPDEAFEPLAEVVAEGLRARRSYWYSTQELVWGVTGLGKMIGKVTKSFSAPKLIANGKSVAPKFIPDAKKDLGDRTFSLYRASEYESLALKSTHKDTDKLYLVLSSEGVRPKTPWKTGGKGISIKRRYLDERGEPIAVGDPIDLGDLVYVEISVRNKTAKPITNVALVDRFPAALEIENPRLGRGTRIDWLENRDRWYPEHMNLRDDRIEAFGVLPHRRTVKLVYLVRAVTAGKFTVPPVSIEAMYNPAIWARQRGPQLTVAGPWDDK